MNQTNILFLGKDDLCDLTFWSYWEVLLDIEIMSSSFRSYCDADSRPASAASGVMRPQQPVTIKRRVSRVESLRNLLFNRGSQNGNQNGHQNDAKKLLLKKRARSAEKDKAAEKVDRFTEHKNKISIWETRQLFASRKSISIPFIKLVQQCKLFFIHIERLS